MEKFPAKEMEFRTILKPNKRLELKPQLQRRIEIHSSLDESVNEIAGISLL